MVGSDGRLAGDRPRAGARWERGRRRRATVEVTLLSILVLATVASAARAAKPPAQLGLPWKVDEKAQLLNGPHANNFDLCNNGGNHDPCNSLDLIPQSGNVRAARAGTVLIPNCGGNLVMVNHGDGWWTGYYHLNIKAGLATGDPVNQGDLLGTISKNHGCGGRADPAHVHFFVKYVPPGQSVGDPFDTPFDQDLQNFVIGGWKITKCPGCSSGFTGIGGCMTYVNTAEQVCTPDGLVTNKGGPTAPSSLKNSAGDLSNDVELKWDAATGGSGGIASYRVFRDGVQIGSTAGTSLLYRDASLRSAGTTSTYTVAAVDGNGVQGPPSNAVKVTVKSGSLSGRAWLTVAGRPTFCRRTGLPAADFSSQHLACTTDSGGTWTTDNSPGGIDWGYDSGRAWLNVGGHATFCRRTGLPAADFSSQHLTCTTDNGGTWTTDDSPGGMDWGYEGGRAWLVVNGKPTFCRLTGLPAANHSTQHLTCTTDDGGTWSTDNSPGGMEWGYDNAGRAWLVVRGHPTFCGLSGLPAANHSTQHLTCTTDAGGTWTADDSPGGMDWGYDNGRTWVNANNHPTFCRRTGLPAADHSTQHLACTTDSQDTWTTDNSPGSMDWGYDSGRAWMKARYPDYCRLTGLPAANFTTQHLACTTDAGGTWATDNSPGGIDWGYDNSGRGWLVVTSNQVPKPTFCRLTGLPAANFSTQHLTCTSDTGGTWATDDSPGGMDWGYDN